MEIECYATPVIYFDDSVTEEESMSDVSTDEYDHESPTPRLYDSDEDNLMTNFSNQFDAINEDNDFMPVFTKPYVFAQNRGIRETLVTRFVNHLSRPSAIRSYLVLAAPKFFEADQYLEGMEKSLLFREPIKPFPMLANFDYQGFFIELIKTVYNSLAAEIINPRELSLELGDTHILGNLRVKDENLSDVLTAPHSLFTIIQLKRTCRLFYDIIKSASNSCQVCNMPYLSPNGWKGGLQKQEITACPNCCQMDPDWWIYSKLKPMTFDEYRKRNDYQDYYAGWVGCDRDVYHLITRHVDTSKFKKGFFLPQDRDDFVKYGQGFIIK